jgi:hypothetical protein
MAHPSVALLPPNPRLQRTRFALLRSPLSRKPLGRRNRFFVGSIIVGLGSVGLGCTSISGSGSYDNTVQSVIVEFGTRGFEGLRSDEAKGILSRVGKWRIEEQIGFGRVDWRPVSGSCRGWFGVGNYDSTRTAEVWQIAISCPASSQEQAERLALDFRAAISGETLSSERVKGVDYAALHEHVKGVAGDFWVETVAYAKGAVISLSKEEILVTAAVT